MTDDEEMIDRYSYPEMRAIWEPANKYTKWLQVEIEVASALADIGEVPREAADAIRAKAHFDVARIAEYEGEAPGADDQTGKAVRHDLIAFLKSVMDYLGPERKYLHLGVTSYDIEDTALALLLRESADLILADLDRLMAAVRDRAREHKYTIMVGRSHGVHAEPITLGLKLAVWLAELQRGRGRLVQARESISCGKVSGAVGAYGNIDPRVEEIVCGKLGLAASPASTQVLQRDRIAHYLCSLAILAGSIEQFATEVRNLQRTDILELEERFARGQRGSSAMPHKRNPIISERMTGLARLIRSYVTPALENMALWHERDICHSSVERVMLPDANILIDYVLRKFTEVVANLTVYPEHMRENLDRTHGLVASETVMLALVRAGMDKDDAYQLVQRHALAAWEQGKDFRAALGEDSRVTELLTPEALEACFDYRHHVRHVDVVFQRLGL
jgi:adenylosuccinate lyase